MVIAIFGGSFNPPHREHIAAARAALSQLKPDRFFMIPPNEPPHKSLAEESPGLDERLELLRIATGELEGVEILDIELRRPAPSYTADTLRELDGLYPEAEFYFLLGTDMAEGFDQWKDSEYLLARAALAVFTREKGEDERLKDAADRLVKQYGARIVYLEKEPVRLSSTQVRELLRGRDGVELLNSEVYRRIIKHRYFGAKPNFDWLWRQVREFYAPERIPHVEGCEKEAVSLARHWGADEGNAREAAILHDITKKMTNPEQLLLGKKYGIMTGDAETCHPKLMHAPTGAALSRDLFGIGDEVYGAILWHTTGRPGMTLLEKIIYLADYIEPTRSFDGLRDLRKLAYENIDEAMIFGLELSLQDLQKKGISPDSRSQAALDVLRNERERRRT